MTREEAIEKAEGVVLNEYLREQEDRTLSRGQLQPAAPRLFMSGTNVVAILERLGLLKFDEPMANNGQAPIDKSLVSMIQAAVNGRDPIRALREDLFNAGYTIVKRKFP